jgi:hypothetical protein
VTIKDKTRIVENNYSRDEGVAMTLEPRMKNRKKMLTIIIILGIMLVCVVLFIRSPLYIFFDMMVNQDPFDDRAFNQKVWLDHDEDWSMTNPRGRMAYSVRDLLLESRMTREEVRELLGPPEIDSERHSIQYLLGAWSSIRIDPDYLVISFDEDDRAIEVRIIPN